MTARFAYDDVPYDTEANAEAHPRAIATLARLHGMSVAKPRTSRVLEIACGNGDHSIVAAAYMPEARFVGFDLAQSAIDAGRAIAPPNVELSVRDLRDGAPAGASFDYVVAHGLYSWVPEPLREIALATIRAALVPNGVGFLSMNARPGWDLTRALREIVLAAAPETAPEKKVAAALARIESFGERQRDDEGFAGALAAHARSWLAHVRQTLPPDAPFSRYVFHDLLADENEAFSVDELAARLAKAGLAIVCETPYRFARAPGLAGLATAMAEHGTPFLQVLVRRDDAVSADAIDETVLAEMSAWSPRRAPRFEPATKDGLLAGAAAEIDVVVDPPNLPPAIVPLVRARAEAAVARGAASAVLTSALHRSFTVGWPELVVVRDLDGQRTPEQIAARVAEAVAAAPSSVVGALDTMGAGSRLEHVRAVIDRFERYAFFRRAGEAS